MCQFATVPDEEHAAEEKLALRAAAPLRTQNREDCRLAERIKRGRRATGHGTLQGVEVFVSARIVIPVGRVPGYYLKQVAQAAAPAIPGAHRTRNDLHVVRPS